MKEILEQEEPIPPFKQRYEGKLEGILGSVKQTYNSEYLNPTILDASAGYFNQFVRGHAFENGNKRLAVLYTDWFLFQHEVEFTLTSSEMYNFAVTVAKAGESNIKPEVTKEWSKRIIKEFTKSFSMSERLKKMGL